MTDNNEQLMTQFIERATPKLLESMQDTISKMVEDQIGGLVENSTKMLDEIKGRKRELEEAAKKQQEDAGQLQRLLEAHPKNAAAVHDALNPQPVQISKTQALDPALYRRAKAQAEQAGTQLQIVSDE